MQTTALKVFYTVGELAQLAGLSKRTILRMLRANDVAFYPARPRSGQTVRVSFQALAKAMPDLLGSSELLGRVKDALISDTCEESGPNWDINSSY